MVQLAQTKWDSPTTNEEAAERLAEVLNIHAITARLLVNRGIVDQETAIRFLTPSWEHLHDPSLLPDMPKASARICEAIKIKERIFIHGDYDVDGVTSTALFVRSLTALGASVIYRVPHRKADGYDLKIKALDWAHGEGANLVVTADCGVLAHEAVDHANALGMTVIVTDHHEPGKTLPNAYAVVNPHRHDSTYPFTMLSGVAVAFKTMQSVVKLLRPEHERAFLERFVDLVACGTIADVMPLDGENRVFAKFGLEALSRTRKVGLQVLIDGTGVDATRPMTSDTVGFSIAPRINAVGRLDDAAIALDLLLTNNREEAAQIVDKLNDFNFHRQDLQKAIFAEALLLVQDKDLESTRVIVLASQGWNSGVVGIVAGKLVEMFHRPAIVIGVDDAMAFGKGSARSIPGFDLCAHIRLCQHLLQSCGGHEMAAGLTLKMENFDQFDALINEFAAKVIHSEDMVPTLMSDGLVDPKVFSLPLLEEFTMLAPFGLANPEPRFFSKDLVLCESRRIGRDNSHLKLRVRTPDISPTDCVAWGKGDFADTLVEGQSVEALYCPQINEWNGKRSVQFIVKDIRTT